MPSRTYNTFRPVRKHLSEPSAGSLAKRQKNLFGYVAPDAPKVVGATASAIVEDYAWKVIEKSLAKESHKNLPIIFPNQDAFRAAYQQLELTFPEDLFQILTSPSPPSIDWIKSLEDIKGTCYIWAVYFVLLQKEGPGGEMAYKLYTGTGTATVQGYRARRRDYEEGRNLGELVETALDSGFEIVHIAPVIRVAKPSSAKMLIGRAVIGVLEGTIGAMFGTFELKFSTTILMAMSLWPYVDLPWGGLCSHNPLEEHSFFKTLNAEQYVAEEAARKEKLVAAGKIKRRERRDLAASGKDPSMQCPKCRLFFPSKLERHIERCKGPKSLSVPKIPQNQCRKCKRYFFNKYIKNRHQAKCDGTIHPYQQEIAVDLSDEDDTNSDTDDDSDTNDDFAPAGKLNEEDFPKPSGDDAIATLASSSSKPNQRETIELSSDHDTPTKSNKRAALKMAAIVIDDDSDSDTPSIKASPSAQDADLLGFMATAEELIKFSNAQSLAGVDLSAFVTMTQGLIKSASAKVKTRESEPKEPVKPEAFVKAEAFITAQTIMKAEKPMKAPGVARGGVAKLRRGRGRKCKNKGVADTEDEADD